MCTHTVNLVVLKVSYRSVTTLSCNNFDDSSLPCNSVGFQLLRTNFTQSLNLCVLSRELIVALLPKTATALFKYHITQQETTFVEHWPSIRVKCIPLLFVCITVRYSGCIFTPFYFDFGRTLTRVGYKLTSTERSTNTGFQAACLLNISPFLAHVSYCERLSSFLIFTFSN